MTLRARLAMRREPVPALLAPAHLPFLDPNACPNARLEPSSTRPRTSAVPAAAHVRPAPEEEAINVAAAQVHFTCKGPLALPTATATNMLMEPMLVKVSVPSVEHCMAGLVRVLIRLG